MSGPAAADERVKDYWELDSEGDDGMELVGGSAYMLGAGRSKRAARGGDGRDGCGDSGGSGASGWEGAADEEEEEDGEDVEEARDARKRHIRHIRCATSPTCDVQGFCRHTPALGTPGHVCAACDVQGLGFGSIGLLITNIC